MSERTRGERASFGVVCGVTRAYEEIRRYDATTRREKKQTAATQLDIPSRHPLVIPSSSPSRRVTSPAAGRVPTDGGAFQRVSRLFRRPPRGIPGERVSRRRRVVGRHLGRDVLRGGDDRRRLRRRRRERARLGQSDDRRREISGVQADDRTLLRLARRGGDERASRVGVFGRSGVGVRANRGGGDRGGDAVGFAATRVTAPPSATIASRVGVAPASACASSTAATSRRRYERADATIASGDGVARGAGDARF